MITFCLLGVLPLLSDFIMEGTEFYHHRGIMKCLLILYPAFLFAYSPDKVKISDFMKLVMIIMLISTCYSLYHYIIQYDDMFLTYKQSGTVITLSYKDHIRISWMTVISCIFALYQMAQMREKSKKWYAIYGIYIIIQIIFLHILGAKTGLITLYLTLLILATYFFIWSKKWLLLFAIPIVLSMPFVAYKTIPSFEQRVHFIKYDFEHYSKMEYREGLSDALRYYSLLAGKEIIEEYTWFGTGFSQLQHHVNTWYRKNVPSLSENEFFLPSSEIVIYWASGGILCLLIFLFHLLYPFFDVRMRINPWFLAFFIPSAFSFCYETHLEGQLPLFVYGFFATFFWYLAYFESKINGEPILANR
jgi:hypothetical protein